jgi:hypothetical protein
VSPKYQTLPDYVDWLEKVDQYGLAVSQKEVMGQGHPSPTNNITLSIFGSARYWNCARYPITRVCLKDLKYICYVLYYAL